MLRERTLSFALLVSSVAVLGFAAMSEAQGNGTLLAGQSLLQGEKLTSPDGRCYLEVQSDGNLVLYSAQVVALYQAAFYSAIFATQTYGASPQPFSLVMQEDCNLVLLSGSEKPIFSSGTANQGSGPCRLVVSGAGGGGFAVLDSQNATIFFEGAYSPSGTLPGMLPTGTVLKQDVKLFSADGTVCLIPQGDGNLVLYNVALLRTYGSATAASAIWASGTYGTGSAPFTLTLQPDCILRLLSSSGAAVYSSGPTEGSPPCQLTVSSGGGGFIRVTDSAHRTLFVQPTIFQVLLDGGYPESGSATAGQSYQIYDAPTGTVFQTASSSLTQIDGPTVRTLLPTTNSVLACQMLQGESPVYDLAGCEIFSGATRTWTPTGQLVLRIRNSFGMATLNDGSALVFAGVDGSNQLLNETELYRPATGVWTPIGSLAVARTDVQFARLFTGQVVVAGGSVYNPVGPPSIEFLGATDTEVFNPFSLKWSIAGPLLTGRTFHQLVTLDDGRVLAVGGATGTVFLYDMPGSQILSSCEIFDPSTGTWTPTGSLGTGRALHRATLLASGRVLATGGYVNATTPGSSQVVTMTVASSEIYDPITGTWTPGPDMPAPRANHEQVTLPSGQVFVSSGSGNNYSSQLFNEAAGTWSATGYLVLPDLASYGVLFRG